MESNMKCPRIQQLLSHVTTDRRLKFITFVGTLYIISRFYVAVNHQSSSSWDNRVYSKVKPKNSSIPVIVPKVDEFASDSLPDDITVVTAYFDLGTFQKGKFWEFSKENYLRWMKSYSMLNNSVIVYTDSDDVAFQMKSLREHFPADMTKIFKVDRNSFWAFKLAPQIKDIYQTPGYPKYPPNTVNENYSCAMHIKYELIEKVIKERMYKTKYIAWADVGYFHQKEYREFKLLPLKSLRQDHIAFVQAGEFNSTITPLEIIQQNAVWLAGGLFIGRPEYLLVFVEDYKSTVTTMLNHNFMDTDQQVLYIMFSEVTEFQPRVPVQTYAHPCKFDWFYLGGLCRDVWEREYRKSVVNLMKLFFLVM